MNKKSTKSEIIFMLLLSLVCAVLLGGTRAAIGERAELSERTVEAVYEIMERGNCEVGGACEVSCACEVADAVKYASHVEDRDKGKGKDKDKGKGKDRDNYYERFLKEFELIQKGKIKFWRNASDSALLTCEATGSGMWGEITIVFVYNTAKKQFLGLRVTEQNETAGLGSRITEEDFYSQFTERMPDISVASDEKEATTIKVDAISGATTSSRAVEKLLQKALRSMP